MANYNVLSSTRNESDREGEEARERGRRLSNFILSKTEKKRTAEMKRGALCTSSTHPVNITTMRVEETQKACKGVSIKDVIIQF